MHARTLHGAIVEHREAEGAAEAAEGPELVAEQGDEVLGVGRIGGRRSVSHSVRYVQEADVYVDHHLHARVQAGSIDAGHLYTYTHAHTQSSQTLDRRHAAAKSICSCVGSNSAYALSVCDIDRITAMCNCSPTP